MMDIVKCTEEYIAEVGAMYDNAVFALENSTNYPRWIYKVYPTVENVKRCTENGELYICINNDRAVGAYKLNADPEGNYDKGSWRRQLKVGEYLVIHMLAVAVGQFGNGIGKAMVSHALETARKGGYKAVRLDVVPDNIPAIKLYTGLGFTYAGTFDLERGIEHVPEFSLFEFNL